jgi:hypothetical protein
VQCIRMFWGDIEDGLIGVACPVELAALVLSQCQLQRRIKILNRSCYVHTIFTIR